MALCPPPGRPNVTTDVVFCEAIDGETPSSDGGICP